MDERRAVSINDAYAVWDWKTYISHQMNVKRWKDRRRRNTCTRTWTYNITCLIQLILLSQFRFFFLFRSILLFHSFGCVRSFILCYSFSTSLCRSFFLHFSSTIWNSVVTCFDCKNLYWRHGIFRDRTQFLHLFLHWSLFSSVCVCVYTLVGSFLFILYK